MTIKTDTYTGNGTRQDISVGFKPELVIVIPATAEHCGVKIEDFWCGRSNVLSATDSFISGAKLTDKGFSLGSGSRMNGNGVAYHYLAVARSSALKMAFAGIQGNGQTGRVVKLDDSTLTPAAVIAKRDSPRDGVLQVGSSTTALLGATASTEAGAITALSQGQFTVSNSVYVNEYNAGAELGEGIDFIAFESGANFSATSYTGNGANRSVNLGFQPKAVLVAKISGTVQAGRIKTDTMGSDNAKALSNSQAMTSHGITFTATGFDLTAASILNSNNDIFVVVAFRDHTESAIPAPAVKKSGKKAIFLPGRTSGSHIDCGTSDSLIIDGAITLEWVGAIEPVGRATPVPFLWRGSATANTASTCSLALYANGFVGSPGNWSGPLLAIGCGDRLDLATSSIGIRSSWRTGLLLEYGKLAHLMATHDGTGGWNFYKNGKLIRQRKLDLVTDGSMPNIDGISGHRMMIGGMYNSGAAVNNLQRQRFCLGRLYNRALTPSEVASRFARAGLGSSEADVTSGLVEEWDAVNASGSTLAATVSSANNGAIVGGSIITL